MMKILEVDDGLDEPLLFKWRFPHKIRSGARAFAFAPSGAQALAYSQRAHRYSEAVPMLSDASMPGISARPPGSKTATSTVPMLSDASMPGINGPERLRRIKLAPAAPPPTVMMVTACDAADNRRRALPLGAPDLPTRPFRFATLRQKPAPLQAP